jgi:hypothetical protein
MRFKPAHTGISLLVKPLLMVYAICPSRQRLVTNGKDRLPKRRIAAPNRKPWGTEEETGDAKLPGEVPATIAETCAPKRVS